MSTRVTISISDGIADVRLNRADKRNAIDGEMFVALAEAGERLKTEPAVRVVVLSGEGPSFCAGLDLSSMQELTSQDPAAAPASDSPAAMKDGQIGHLGQQICWVWQEVPVPVIAAVHGHAIGGGIQIALGADIRIVHPDTKMSVRETYWGLVPDMSGTFTLTRLVRPDIAKELTFTARVFDGREAHNLGLVTTLSDDPFNDAMALARDIAARSPGAVRGAKSLLNAMTHDGAGEQFANERRVIGEQVGTANQLEALVAGVENRAPAFIDE